MADFSLTTLFVVPVGQTTLPSAVSTQDLTAGQVGLFSNAYAATSVPGDFPYFYVAQGRTNTYLQGSKRSDKIKGCPPAGTCHSNVTEWYKVNACPTPTNQIIDINDWTMQCGDTVTLTLRAHSNYIHSIYHNGFMRSVTVNTPCCECGEDPCTTVDVDALIDSLIAALALSAPGINPDNVTFSDFFTFERVGTGATAKLRIHGKALTAYGQPCDVAAFPHEYDRMWFQGFVYAGPATTADFIVSDACSPVATVTTIQTSNYATGTSAEIAQLEKNFHSYQAGYLKHLYRMVGYNGNFESWVADGTAYDTYYIKFNELDQSAYNWGDYIKQDATVIIAVESGSAMATALEAALEDALGEVASDNVCVTTTTTTTAAATTTTTTTTAAATTTTTTTAAPTTTTTTTAG
jgi:hypothetical protein